MPGNERNEFEGAASPEGSNVEAFFQYLAVGERGVLILSRELQMIVVRTRLTSGLEGL